MVKSNSTRSQNASKKTKALKTGKTMKNNKIGKIKKMRKIDFTTSVITSSGASPRLENAVLIIGLPGIGLVSKMAVDHLTRYTHARRFARLYSPHFPNQVLALKSGKLRAFTMRFYEKSLKKRDVVFLRGDLQPLTVEGQYEVTAKILSFARSLGVTSVIAMAGYAVQKNPVNAAGEKPSVYCAATSEAFHAEFKRAGAKPTTGVVPIVGMAGLVPAISRVYGLEGACLLVETPGTMIDPHGAKALVEFLGKWFQEKFDTHDLEKRAKRAEKMFRKMEEQAQSAQSQPAKAGAPAAPEPIKRESLSYIR